MYANEHRVNDKVGWNLHIYAYIKFTAIIEPNGNAKQKSIKYSNLFFAIKIEELGECITTLARNKCAC